MNKYLIIITCISFFFLVFINLGLFFDITSKPIKSDIIVCMGGGIGDRMQKSLELLNNNYSNTPIILSSDANEKERDRKLKVIDKNELSKVQFLSFSKNTYEELLLVKKTMLKNNYKSVLIVSTPTHSRRIDFLIKNYIKFLKYNLNYTLISNEPDWWDKFKFYKNKHALTSVVHESVKLFYNFIYYTFLNKLSITSKYESKLENYKKEVTRLINKFMSSFKIFFDK